MNGINDAPAGTRRSRLLRPAVVLPVIAAIVVLVAVLTPEEQAGRSGDPRLSSYSPAPLGARALYELAGRLGWQVERRLDDSTRVGDPKVIQAVLAPVEPPTAQRAHAILEGVRRGGALLYVIGDRDDPLADSLWVERGPSGVLRTGQTGGARPGGTRADDDECGAGTGGLFSGGLPLWPDGKVHLWAVSWSDSIPPELAPFDNLLPFGALAEDPDSDTTDIGAAAAGYHLGNGRVVVVADPDLLRNDVLRVCRWGADVIAVRLLEYLSGDPRSVARRSLIVFDEYAQGYGEHPGTVRAVVGYLSRTPSGHAVLQLAAAGLVLLFALGPRALPPRDPERVERRSPLEHVDALAHAYERVGATRTAVSRLLHGVRRRTERMVGGGGGGGGDVSDDGFLDAALARDPALAEDVAAIRRALQAPVGRRELESVGAALGRVEASLSTPTRWRAPAQ